MVNPVSSWEGNRVLITGVCGTIGRELLRQVVDRRPAEVIGIDNNESELFFVRRAYESARNVRLYVGEMREKESLLSKLAGVDIVLHTAAYKHVGICESSPRETVINNVIGIQNLIEASREAGVSRVLFTSSDKAVNPTSVMGTTKLLGERLMAAADVGQQQLQPLFVSARFGNVLGSRGSVIPLFSRQIRAGGPVTLTDRDMTRFIMSLDEAVRLVMDSVFVARGGEVFVTKMPVVRIEDLAHVMIEELAPGAGFAPSDVHIEIIGTKPGEKMYEELLNEEEVRRAVELANYFVVLPALRPASERGISEYRDLVSEEVAIPYNSANQPSMDRDAVRVFLRKHNLLGRPEAEARSLLQQR